MKLTHFLALVAVIAGAGIWLLVKACHKAAPPKMPVVEAPTPAPTPVVPDVPSPPTQAAAPGQPTADTGAKVDLPARAYDAEVIAWKDRSIPGDKEKDVSKGKPYKINVYKDAGQTNVNRAKVDANRNDKWEDKYTFEPGTITLQRAPADDEQYTETYHWTGRGWTKQ